MTAILAATTTLHNNSGFQLDNCSGRNRFRKVKEIKSSVLEVKFEVFMKNLYQDIKKVMGCICL